ncbi:SDR family NAD(P)-dependent oxidoreductase [Actinomadura gamaensis]|uniref:SDR family NAD(P)-dependent oxidoreductase n=1 Tax=Actinomadura gamaensis TaxID=1763541 RepID=A0ABV9UDW2_9ACTN
MAVFRPRPAVPVRGAVPALPAGALVLTEDPRIAAQVRLRTRNDQVRIVCTGPEAAAAGPLPWAEPAMLDGLLGNPPAARHIRVIVSLRDLCWPQSPASSLIALQELMFLAARRLAADDQSRHAPSEGTSTAPRATGDSLAVLVLDPLKGGVPHPHSALLTGLVKCLRWELPDLCAYAVVTDAGALDLALRQLADESTRPRGLPVVHYRDGRRWEEHLVPAPAGSLGGGLSSGFGGTAARPGVDDASVIVAAGGARGITATALRGLLRSARPTLWLLGSAPLEQMVPQVRALGRRDRRTYIADRLREAPGTGVAEAGAEYDRLRNAREALRTLQLMKDHCGASRVHYQTCDVTDREAVRRAAEAVHRTTDHVDLLINAAGIGGARRLAAKSLDVYRRVRSVKVDGYLHLKAAFDHPPPGRWCSFSSIAGLVGLPGESDYGPANDMLDLAARYEAAHRGRDELAICWTMWGESGLGPRSAFVAHTRRTGHLSLLSDEEGQRLFLTELGAVRPPGQDVVCHLGAAEQRSLRDRFPDLPRPEAFLDEPPEGQRDAAGASVDVPARAGRRPPTRQAPIPRPHRRRAKRNGRSLQVSWELDLSGHDYLTGHRRGHRAVLPGALAVELAVQAVHRLAGAVPVTTVNDVAFRAPVALRPRLARYELAASHDPAQGDVRVEICSRVEHPSAPPTRRSHMSADVALGHPGRPVTGPPLPPPRTGNGRSGAVARLTGVFAGIDALEHTPDGVIATWHIEIPDHQRKHFERMRTPWILLDALLQTAAALPTPGALATPGRITAVTLIPGDNDLLLSDRHPTGLRLAVGADRSQATATAPDGQVLLRVQGLRLVP